MLSILLCLLSLTLIADKIISIDHKTVFKTKLYIRNIEKTLNGNI